MGSVTVLQDNNYPPQEKGKESVVESLMSSAQRKKLADITNLPQEQVKQQMKSGDTTQNTFFSSKEYVEKLQKENMTLIKAVAHRNNIIERSGVEIQKLRVNLRSVQEKNLQFAQANNQMLEELNINRDRLKVLQHELSCKNALLNAKKMQLEEQILPFVTSQENDTNQRDTKKKGTSKITSSGDSTVKPIPVNEKANTSKRRVSGVVDANGICEETCQTEDDFEKGVDSLGENQMVDDVVNKTFVLDALNPVKDSVPSKRQCARRQSTRFHVQETEQAVETADAEATKEPARLLKRRSARLRPEEVEPCKSFHDREGIKETIKKRRVSSRQQSAGLDFQEAEVIETLNADDAGCLVIEESIESKSVAVEEQAESRPDTKEMKAKRRVSTRRESAKTNSQTATETDEVIKEVATSLCNNVVQECDLVPSSEDHEISESRQDAKETKAKRRVSTRRQSAKTKSQTPTETDEAIKEVETSLGIKECDAVPLSEDHEPAESRQDAKETKVKRRVSTRRQSPKTKSQTATETDEALREVPSSEDHEKEPKNKPKADETEEMVRRTSVGRPSRHAAEKVQSYREVSLKVKMRRN